MDLVDKQAAMECCFKPKVTPGGAIFDALKMAIRNEIEALPEVEATPVVCGKWKMKEMGLWQECSVCGVAVEIDFMYMCKASEDKNFKYCPHCGARMEESNDT